jgi:lysophospholipase L1-like esterase
MSIWKKTLIGIAIVFIGVIAFGFYMFSQMQTQLRNEDPAYWEKEVSKIEARYKGNYPQDVIVFYGSSSIRKWKTLEEDMMPLSVVNHGFGGSKVADAIYYVDRLVTPFHPKAVVLFVGTNDINGLEGNSKSGEQVFESTVKLFETIQSQNPDVPIYYIPISPTKMRWEVWDEADKANHLIAEYAANHDKITFIDTTEALLDENGGPNKALLAFDGLHLNKDGYAVWTSIIKPVLETDLQ